MKQNITRKDLNDLTEQGREKLRKWWDYPNKKYVFLTDDVGYYYSDESIGLCAWTQPDQEGKSEILPLLSIGQMIEFLTEYEEPYGNSYYETEISKDTLVIEDTVITRKDGNICEVLWLAVKEKLNELS